MAGPGPSALTLREARPAGFRYGGVFLVTFVLLVFQVAAPSADWAHAVAVGLEGVALIVVVVTSGAHLSVRRKQAIVLGAVALAVVAGIAAGVVPDGVTFLLSGLIAAAIPALLVRGLLRLVREHGVTLQAVAGALAIYLLVGLLFAWAVGFASAVDSHPYFAQGPDVPDGVRVYFSFTVLTTTGFGDYTTASAIGRALAVVEMLLGQLYLVTIIGLMVGSFAGRRRA